MKIWIRMGFLFWVWLHGAGVVRGQSFVSIEEIADKPVNVVYTDAQNLKWIGTDNGLFSIENYENNTYKVRFEKAAAVSAMCLAADASVWIGTYKGDIMLKKQHEDWKTFTYTESEEYMISALSIDKKNQVWAALYGFGVRKLSAHGELLKTYIAGENCMLSKNIYDIFVDTHQIKWFATEEGLFSLSSDEKTWSKHEIADYATAITMYKGDIWVACMSVENGVELFRYKDYKEWKKIELPAAISSSKISDFYVEEDTFLWLTGHQVGRYDGDGGWKIFGEKEGINSHHTLSLSMDNKKNIWIGSAGKGLFAFLSPSVEVSKETTIVAASKMPETLQELLEIENPNPNVFTNNIRLNIQFEQSKADIQSEYRQDLEHLAALLRKYPHLSITLEGHTDHVGNVMLNQLLSQQRADTIKKYLIQEKNIPENRIKAVGYGSRYPITTRTDAASREQNRRVEVKFAWE